MKSLNQFIDETGNDTAVRFYSGKFDIVNAMTNRGTKFKLINLPFIYAARYIRFWKRLNESKYQYIES